LYHQWRRSVVKYGGQGQSGQATKLFQITLYVNDLQTIPVPDSLQAPRKIISTFHLCRRIFILDDAKLAELSNISFE